MSDRLRVLMISGEYPPMEGGVADFTRLLGEALNERGARVHVLTSARAAYQAQSSAVRCHPLVRHWGWRPLYRAVWRLIDALRPQVINIQYQTGAYQMHPAINLLPWVLRWRGDRWNVPVVTTFHDLLVPYLFPKAGPLRWGANLALARGSRAVIVTNPQDEARLAAYSWIARLARIPIGSNVGDALPQGYERAAWRKQWQIAEDALVLCYFGFLDASKGGEELIEALDNLCRSGYNPVLLMIGGAVGRVESVHRAHLERVRALIQDKGLASRVIWTGYLSPPEVSAAFHSADLCVLPYRDGASFRRGSLMAALAHGMPIVTTEPEVALPELVHGENLWIVPARDPQALSAAIAHLAANPSLRRRLGIGARALSRSFDWQHIAARTLEVYHAVAAS